jgi:hypothetical protein
MRIDKNETLIIGAWTKKAGKVEADANARRIEALIHGYLRKIGTDDSGWDILYEDPNDGRFWELLYLESESHGGGPPTLRCISKIDAIAKYSKALKA